jgi:hypothetical protein
LEPQADSPNLVERLRHEGADAFQKQYSLGMWRLCAEAADEIERLTKELEDEEKVTYLLMDMLKKIAAHPDAPPLIKQYARGELHDRTTWSIVEQHKFANQ